MNWLEISVQVGDEEAAGAICDLFDRYGQGGAVQEQIFPDECVTPPITVKTYLPVGPVGHRKRCALEKGLSRLATLYPLSVLRFKELREEDWANAWKAWFRPQRIGRHVVVKLPEQDYRPFEDDIVIDLEPGMAFGTGLHPTTRMCLVFLENHVQVGDRVLDMGTGSGILAIAAAKLGAAAVLALDDDPVALHVAHANVSLNGLADAIQVEEGSLAQLAERAGLLVDGISINILAEVIASMAEKGLTSYLKPEGWLVAGGISEEAEPLVRAAFERCGLRISDRSKVEDWVTLCAVRVRPAVGLQVQAERTESGREEA